ncbi:MULTISPECIES: AfsR/SARP family transcriptional regulator [Actinomadura]|uniref:BTAD domain-containing putative transcriptional regulator n=1 Tax=Actinomadura yumaensis TaxID=111807 RepID=A0ABW2CJ87_9ACTN|nr:AfsR/SARP family transcriptional regulator [Actinomadura sp. J1-007]MWK40691.1 activator protein [Actinomadura sp. J1-007]QFU19845.1 transcriptional regulator [Actinomadura sp.]
MRYEILGPFQVVDEDGKHTIRARKIRVLLTVLLVRADQVVPVDQLITEIWGEAPPRRATAGLHVYISQIRKFLHRPGAEDPVLTRPPGYLLRLGADELDLRRLELLVNQGRNDFRQGRHDQASAAFEEALDLSADHLPDDLGNGPVLEGFHTWLRETRLECVEMLMESRMMLGRHRELVGDLYQLTTEHPLREVLHRQLMLALYRSGRRADALHAYQSARRTLNEELGLEPCRDLQNLQRSILTSDHRLDLPIPA